MSNNLKDIIVTIVTTFICCSSIWFGIYTGAKTDSYKQGQIDAINHQIHYQLQTQSDSSKVWVKIN